MRLGVCASIEKADLIRAAGFDFIECTVSSLKPDKSDEEFRETMELFLNSPLPVESFNVFIPGDLKVVGDSVDYDRLRHYLEKAMGRVHTIGGKIIVFGSGNARNIPDGFARERAEEQLERFLHLVADYAEPLGITIVIEPLNTKESNIINNVPEAYALAKRVNRPSICALADFYHMDEEKEPLSNIVECRDRIRHVHVADTGRLAPGTGQYPYDAFVESVRTIEHDVRVSIECKWKDFGKEVVEAGKFMRRTFASKS